HTSRREAVQFGVEGTVILGDEVRAGFGSPGDALHLLLEQVRRRRSLGCPEEFLFMLGQVSREALDARREHPYAPVRDLDVRENFSDGKLVLLALRRLVLVRRERGDVDEAGDSVIRSGGGDDTAAV